MEIQNFIKKNNNGIGLELDRVLMRIQDNRITNDDLLYYYTYIFGLLKGLELAGVIDSESRKILFDDYDSLIRAIQLDRGVIEAV